MVSSPTQPSAFNLRFNRRRQEAQCFVEPLGDDLGIQMTLVPGGTFLMGSPPDELDRRDNEGPQHTVTVAPFFMGTYPITQEEWRAIASLPQVNRTLELDPSRFKGGNRPVETVSWEDVVEGCDRLSAHTGRVYRLPSEAEWEYACRAGTTTPFHFGPTITTDYANYRGVDTTYGKGSYGPGPLGEYRKETTAVGSFEVANAFGLFDMHGNVWEWCQDTWHSNYQGAPLDGSAWQEDPLHNNGRVRRGGSWLVNPRSCRSAYRVRLDIDNRNLNLGFRVVASAPRTQ